MAVGADSAIAVVEHADQHSAVGVRQATERDREALHEMYGAFFAEVETPAYWGVTLRSELVDFRVAGREWEFEKDVLPPKSLRPFVCECTSDECLAASKPAGR